MTGLTNFILFVNKNLPQFRRQAWSPAQTDELSSFSEPFPDPLFPHLNFFMVLGIARFKIFQETLDPLASRRKDGQADQDKKDALEYGEKEAKNSHDNKKPANDQQSNLLN